MEKTYHQLGKVSNLYDFYELLIDLLVQQDKTLNSPEIFTFKEFSYYASQGRLKSAYYLFEIAKKKNGRRLIQAPTPKLKQIQKSLSVLLQAIYKPSDAVKGYVPHRSIRENAWLHTQKKYVYNLDLSNFFTSISADKIINALTKDTYPFYNKPFLLDAIINISCLNLCDYTTLQKIPQVYKVLPQGAPSSPVLSNIACDELDKKILEITQLLGITYTRYADDITFSADYNHFVRKGGFLKKIHQIIIEEGFLVNKSKNRLLKHNQRQIVTGLVVNDIVNVKRSYIKELRKWIYLWETYGYEKASKYFLNDYRKSKGHVKKQEVDFSKVLDTILNSKYFDIIFPRILF